MQKLLLSMLLSIIMCGAAYSQKSITGKVSLPDGSALPGVSILVKGTTTGTTTDVSGSYQLVVPSESDILVFSFIGYTTKEEAIGNRSVIDVALEDDNQILEEIVVVGYGTSTKKEVTGAVASVDGDELMALNPTRIDQALQGQLAGVQISSSSGSPGGGMNIRIRGLTTNGDNNPLVVVDGIVYSTEGLNALNPADIESISVLKDATAAIYGVRAANGVILVTTKQGRRNTKTAIQFSGYYGVQETAKKLDLLNAREFAILKNETYGAGGLAHPYNNVNMGKGTDWQGEIFQQAPIQNYNVNISGGSEKSTYSIGGSYLDQNGIIGGSKARYRRYNARLNLTTDIGNKVTLQNVLLYTNEYRKTLSENGLGSVLYNTINASPVAPVKTDGRYTYLMEFNDIINPLAQIDNTYNYDNVNKIVGKQELVYTINDNFEVTGRAGYNYAIVDHKDFSPLVWYGTGKAQNTAANENLDPPTREIAGAIIPVPASVAESRTSYFNYSFEAFLNYNQTFGDVHKVKGTFGASIFGNRGEGQTATGYGVPYNSWEFADITNNLANDPILNHSVTWQDRDRLQSFFARAEYNYDTRYLISAIIRRDGSSRFGENNRFGYFPSVSGAWLISEESFFASNKLNLLKLRASYGVSGNDKIGNWRYRASLDGEGVYAFNDLLQSGVAIGTLSNQDLKWETTHQTNVGLDMNMFSNKVTFSVDYYIKKTNDLLFQPDISGIAGGYGPGESSPWVNGGDVRNNGFEFLIRYEDKIGQDLSFSLTYNLTTIKNEVTRMPEGVEFIEGGSFGVGGTRITRMEAGSPLGSFYGYKTDGVYQSEEEIAARAVSQDGAQPGDLRFVDVDKSGSINFSDDSDKTIIGSPIPQFTMGFNLGLKFKGIDFSAMLYSSIGNEILRNYERQQPMANLLSYNRERWTGPGSTNENPRLTTALTRNGVISDYYVEDGSFLRVKNVQLGYTLPVAISQKIGATNLRVYVAANNLFTFTKYQGFDPDFSTNDPLSSGIDYGFYPQARTYMVGLNLNF
ncbi:MAG TPA: TonB-dependent receptor [Ohtaekwangia sp.]|nr:TonB-dependent receptor [Ohtaekwangia sp.]